NKLVRHPVVGRVRRADCSVRRCRGPHLFAAIVSESAIVGRAVLRVLEGVFESVVYCPGLNDLKGKIDKVEPVIVYDVIRPAEDVRSLLQFLQRPAPCRIILLTKATHALREFEPLVGRVTAILPPDSSLEEIRTVVQLRRREFVVLPEGMVPI